MLSRYIKDWTITEYLCKILPMQSSITLKETKTMSNYTETEAQAIIDAAPLDFNSAQMLAKKIGKPYRSVISKAKSLGVDYVSKTATKKRGPNKDLLVDAIAKAMHIDSAHLEGLERATAKSLDRLLEHLA